MACNLAQQLFKGASETMDLGEFIADTRKAFREAEREVAEFECPSCRARRLIPMRVYLEYGEPPCAECDEMTVMISARRVGDYS